MAVSMRSASRAGRIPGVRGPRPAPPAGPAPGARALACGSPAPPGRLRLPGCASAAGGAAVSHRGLGGAAGRSECGNGSGGRSAAAGLSERSPPACRPAAAARCDGGEQLAGGGAEEDPEPAGAGGHRGGARGQPAARAGLREEAEGDRKGPTHHPPPGAPPPPSAPLRPAEPTFPATPPPASGRTWSTWASRRRALGRGPACSPQPFLFISLV